MAYWSNYLGDIACEYLYKAVNKYIIVCKSVEFFGKMIIE